MAVSTKLRLRGVWFQVHKWIGIVLAVLIIPISVTGAALVWKDGLDGLANPDRYAVSGPATLPPARYAAAASVVLQPGERIASIRYPEGEGPVVMAAARPPLKGEGRPVRTMIWLDGADARILDAAASNEGIVRVFHVLHGSLMVPGLGRQIVGWIGVAMLISSLSGIWLWWPVSGRWTRGFRWNRQPSTNANIHHQAGFWIAVPLAMLSFTGVWISFPPFFAALSGAPAPGPRPAPSRPLVETGLTADRALAAAIPLATGPLVSVTWPTEAKPAWSVAFARDGGAPAEVAVDDASGVATPPSPPKPETIARTMRRWHDGTGMGFAFQLVIFLGGILPAALAVTGIVMWLKSRRWRADVARRRAGAAMAPAE